MVGERRIRDEVRTEVRFLEEGSSAPSKSGAKVRPKGVADAQTVDIPLPPKDLSTGTL